MVHVKKFAGVGLFILYSQAVPAGMGGFHPLSRQIYSYRLSLAFLDFCLINSFCFLPACVSTGTHNRDVVSLGHWLRSHTTASP